MKVLVSGATGFIGSHATRRLVAAGHEVAVLARPESNMSRLADVLPRLRVVRSNCDLDGALGSFRPEAMLHAAWGGVFHGRDDLGQFDNVHATVALLEASIAVGCKCWVGLGSLAEYGPWPHMIREETLTRPVTAYGAAKLAACLRTQEICRRVGTRFVWLRLGSVYGPDDNDDWVIPFVGRTLLKGECPALTSGEQRRDFLFVEDAADAINAVLENERAKGIYNLASGHAPPLRETLERLRDLIDPALSLGFNERPSEAVIHLQANPSRLCAVTDWQPRTTLEEGLRRTLDRLKKSKGTEPATEMEPLNKPISIEGT